TLSRNIEGATMSEYAQNDETTDLDAVWLLHWPSCGGRPTVCVPYQILVSHLFPPKCWRLCVFFDCGGKGESGHGRGATPPHQHLRRTSTATLTLWASMRRLMLLVPFVIIIVSIPMILAKVPRNSLYGFRTTYTLSSDEVWYRANKISGIA